MEDNDPNKDEFELTEEESYQPDLEETPATEETYAFPETESDSSNTMKKVYIIVGVALAALVGYSMMGSGGEKAPEMAIPKMGETKADLPIQPKEIMPPQPMQLDKPKPDVDKDREQQLQALQRSQQSIHSEVYHISTQVSQVNSNVNQLAEQVKQMNGIIKDLSAQLDEQASSIARLKAQATKRKKTVMRKKMMPGQQYHIQAVIPGRAWLIATNGSTMTVREGSLIPGYGIVRMIDPVQGKVITSSGKRIEFSTKDN